jgi:hypothetical protein
VGKLPIVNPDWPPRVTCEPLTAWLVDAQPGNGSRYRLVIALDKEGGIASVSWPDISWCAGWLGRVISWEWLRGHSRKALGEEDARAISAIIAARPWETE